MLIVGLGNPGVKYSNTHHNVGFMSVDHLAEVKHVSFKDFPKYKAEIAEYKEDGETFYIMKPQSFMNLSGDAISLFIKNKNITSKDILVIYDDMDLPLGKLRIRQSGSSGGHNGIKSIINNLGTQEFNRIRIGIGRSKESSEDAVVDYVLSKFSKEELSVLNTSIDKIPEIVEKTQKNGILKAMSDYNGA